MFKKFFSFIIYCLFFFFFFPFLTFAAPSTNPNIRPLPHLPFVMLDYQNIDWQKEGYGPLGSWVFFPAERIDKAEYYIKQAQKIKYDIGGKTISKPVGVGFDFYPQEGQTPYTVAQIKEKLFQIAQRLNNNPEFDNLYFVIIGGDCQAYGEIVGGCPGYWYSDIAPYASQVFSNLTVVFQVGGNATAGWCSMAAQIANKNILTKCNGLQIGADTACIWKGQSPSWDFYNGCFCGLKLNSDKALVGFEPAIGPFIENPPASAYFTFMYGLSGHPDLFDLQKNYFFDIKDFEKATGFPAISFLANHISRTPKDTPDVWIVLTESTTEDGYLTPRKYFEMGGQPMSYGAYEGNYDFYLYQKDEAPGSRTALAPRKSYLENGASRFYIPELPSPANKHPYSFFTTKRTDQASGNPYMSFKVDDRYPFKKGIPKDAGGETIFEITLTFVNKGNDKLSLEYKNYQGQMVKKTIQKGTSLGQTNQWIDYTFKLTDAYFNNNLPGQTDFRIFSENDGDEYIHRIIVKGKKEPSPTQPLSTTNFYPGWQQIELKTDTKIPQSCQIITYKEGGVWQNFLSFLGNLLYAPKKKKVWVKCD